MIAVDTNLLIYAHREEMEFHDSASKALGGLIASGKRWGIPWPCLHEFISISTHSRVFDPPSPMKLALGALDAWMAVPNCEMIGEGPGYFSQLKKLAINGKISGPKIHDARIAAICLHNGVKELWTADRDFSRYTSLKTRNPLA